jgi:hypothetical protein
MTTSYYTTNILPLIQETDPLKVVNYFRQRGVLKQNVRCVKCITILKQVKRDASPDKHAFRCPKTECKNNKTYVSLRIDSFCWISRFL